MSAKAPHRTKADPGLRLAREKLVAMSPQERAEITPDRLIGSFGIQPFEAEQLIHAFQGRTQ